MNQHEAAVREAISMYPALWERVGELTVQAESCLERAVEAESTDIAEANFWAKKWCTAEDRLRAIQSELCIPDPA